MLTATVVPVRSTSASVGLDAGLAHPVGAAELQDARRVAALGEPRRGVGGQRQCVGAVRVDQEGDGRHRRATTQPAGAGREVVGRLGHGGVEQGGGLARSGPSCTLAGVHEELDVAGGAGQGGDHRPHDAGSGGGERGRHTLERPAPDVRVTDDALALEAAARPASNCGLTNSTRSAPAAATGTGEGGDDAAQRDEREVRHDERARLRTQASAACMVGGVERARVDALEDDHAAVAAQARVELAVADVDRVDVGGAALEEAVGEATGGGTRIEGAPVARPRRRSDRARRRASARPG